MALVELSDVLFVSNVQEVAEKGLVPTLSDNIFEVVHVWGPKLNPLDDYWRETYLLMKPLYG